MPLIHCFSLVFYVPQGLWLLYHYGWRRKIVWIRWGVAHAGILAGYGIFLTLLNYSLSAHGNTFYNDMPPGWHELVKTFLVFAGGRFSPESPAAYMPLGLSADKVIAVLMVILVIWGGGRLAYKNQTLPEGKRLSGRHIISFLALWLFMPVLLLFAVSWVWHPVFFPVCDLCVGAPGHFSGHSRRALEAS